jgi:hypothetical protein
MDAQPELPADRGWAAAAYMLPCGVAVPVVISIATERDATETTQQQRKRAATEADPAPPELTHARENAAVSTTQATQLVTEHIDWWASYWNKSAIDLSVAVEPVEFGIVQEWYYCMLYLLRSSTRLGAVRIYLEIHSQFFFFSQNISSRVAAT